jgi:hypothetical protein
MIHVRDQGVSLDTIRKVKLKTPDEAGVNWKGIRHGDLIDELLHLIQKSYQWEVQKMRFALSPDKLSMAGAIEVEPKGIAVPDGLRLGVGVCHSNNRHQSLKIVVGATVIICSNGLVTGDVVLSKRHTLKLDWQACLQEAMEIYVRKARKIGKLVDRMKAKELDEDDVNRILMTTGRLNRLGNNGIMPWSWIGQVDFEYRNPTFKEFEPRTAWSLFNAFTWVVKRNPPLGQFDQINKFREILMPSKKEEVA